MQGLLYGGDIAGGNDVPLEVGWGMEHEPVFLQGDGGGIVKPGVDGGGGHVRFHQREYLGQDIGRRIHENDTSFSGFLSKIISFLLYQKNASKATISGEYLIKINK